ncbi:unnamed protein product [Commensalibacter papalotli (ex Botero et al. 2024)]|nr:unnamed protein product [Commensalibacter papalotli (ex Botero et al. 2024)]
MRRPIVILLGFIVLVFVVVIVLFGLKGPEMPIQEVHKVIPMSKFQQQTPTQAIPALPTTANNVQQPIPAMPQPGATPVNATTGNVGQPTGNPVIQGVQAPTAPSQPVNTPSNVTGNATGKPQPNTQSTVPLIIPQSNNVLGNTTAQPTANPPQPIPAMPQPGAVPGNAAGTPAQR